jgi:hypothetical protein
LLQDTLQSDKLCDVGVLDCVDGSDQQAPIASCHDLDISISFWATAGMAVRLLRDD